MNGSGYKSKRRDSGVIPFADENPFSTIKLNSISEMNASTGSTASGASLPKRGNKFGLRRTISAGDPQTGAPSAVPSGSDPQMSNTGISGRRNVKISNLQSHIAIEEDSYVLVQIFSYFCTFFFRNVY